MMNIMETRVFLLWARIAELWWLKACKVENNDKEDNFYFLNLLYGE